MGLDSKKVKRKRMSKLMYRAMGNQNYGGIFSPRKTIDEVGSSRERRAGNLVANYRLLCTYEQAKKFPCHTDP